MGIVNRISLEAKVGTNRCPYCWGYGFAYNWGVADYQQCLYCGGSGRTSAYMRIVNTGEVLYNANGSKQANAG